MDQAMVTELQAQLASRASIGGTLYISSADLASLSLQSQLAEILGQCASNTLQTGLQSEKPRIVASARSTDCLHPDLQSELAFLSFEILPLSQRHEDLEILARHFLKAYNGSPRLLSTQVRSALLARPWPGNIPELRQAMARLATFGGDPQAELPSLSSLDSSSASLAEAPGAIAFEHTKHSGPLNSARLTHPALRRSLDYIADHFTEPLRLQDLARAAYVSPSHLCHLFKQQIGTSPMNMLAKLRVDRARYFLASDRGATITEIAHRSGFGDLRSFERTFKQLVGTTPREYRWKKTET